MTSNSGSRQEEPRADREHDENNRAQAEVIRSALRRKQHAAYVARLQQSGQAPPKPQEGAVIDEAPHTRPEGGQEG